MNSAPQVIIGLLLLVCAFIFGRYIHNQPLDALSTNAITSDFVETGVKPSEQSVFSGKAGLEDTKSRQQTKPESKNLQQSLRQRILGERANATNHQESTGPHSVFKQPLTESSLPSVSKNSPPSAAAIVEPDFSNLEHQSAHSSPLISEPPKFENRSQPALKAPLNDDEKKFARQPEWPPVKTKSQEKPVTESISIAAKKNRVFKNPVGESQPPRSGSRREPKTIRSSTDLQQVALSNQTLNTKAVEYLAYTCQVGDSLHSISQKYYGTSNYYLDIYVHNRDKMRNPSDIRSGVELKIPVYSR